MSPCLAFLNLNGPDMVIIVVAVLILFGSKKIPEFAKGLGQGIREFKKASREVTDEIQNSAHETPPAPRPTVTAQTTAPPSTVPKA